MKDLLFLLCSVCLCCAATDEANDIKSDASHQYMYHSFSVAPPPPPPPDHDRVGLSDLFNLKRANLEPWPRSPNSPYEWRRESPSTSAQVFDNVHLHRAGDHVELITIPHRVSTEDQLSQLDHEECSLQTRKSWMPPAVPYGQSRLLFRTRLSATMIGVRAHPFPRELVSDPDDDLRLAYCGAALSDARSGVATKV